jgi:RNA-directed DNA polymerase
MVDDTEQSKAVETELGLIAKRAAEEPECQFNNLMHLVDEGFLKASYNQLRRNGAEGIDEVSWKGYGEQFEANIKGLLERMKKMSYRPQAVRRVYIPKENGKQRPIGIPTTEDKLVQKAMSRIMEAIYEQDFHGSSYGFRPGRSCHQALRKVGELINFKPINHVIEADIKGFFDKVDHRKLTELLGRRINDRKFLQYVVRFLKSGYMEEDIIQESKEGTPQGGNISPMLANIFLHYVLDEWFEKEVKGRLKGQSYLVRYCDDFIILMQSKEEARMVKAKVEERFREHGLELSDEKTKVMSFGRYEKENAERQKRKANTFDFLGITHYCDISRSGKFKVGRRTSQKRFARRCRAMNQWLKEVRNAMKTREWWSMLMAKIRGHYQYYGMSENYQSIREYYYRVVKMVFKWLNRRNQKKRLVWERFKEYLKLHPLPKPRIVHSFYTWSHA